VVENSGAIHAKEYPKPAAYAQRPPNARLFFFHECRKHPGNYLAPLIDFGRYFFWMEAITT
jgi:hypothetical protein